MKFTLAIVVFAIALVGCRPDAADNTMTASIHASSMVCGSCAKNVKDAVTQVEGVKEVNVDLKEKIVQVRYISEKTNLEALEKAINSAGYDANDRKRDPAAYEKLDKCCKIDG